MDDNSALEEARGLAKVLVEYLIERLVHCGPTHFDVGSPALNAWHDIPLEIRGHIFDQANLRKAKRTAPPAPPYSWILS